MPSQFGPSMVQLLPAASVPDITPPVFAGITSAVPQSNGSVLCGWALATDTGTPITYDLYCLPGSVSAAVLFASTPALSVRALSGYVFRDGAGNLLTDQNYTFGVRARDALNNTDSNVALIIAASAGVLTDDLATIAQELVDRNLDFIARDADFQADHVNFVSDHVNFVADDAAFDSDHANFLADHANFVSGHADFQADHANFLSDHANFIADDAAFDADHANFLSDHANFIADSAAFDTDHANFLAALADLDALIQEIVEKVDILVAQSASDNARTAKVSRATTIRGVVYNFNGT